MKKVKVPQIWSDIILDMVFAMMVGIYHKNTTNIVFPRISLFRESEVFGNLYKQVENKMSETLQDSAQKQLKQFVEQIERLEEDKKGIQDDIKEKYAEAASNGFDKKILKQVIRIRKKSKSEREEQLSVLDTYLHALDMI